MALFYKPLRLLGAATRIVLVRAGAKKLGVDVAECEARQSKVWHKASGRSLGYHEVLLFAGTVGIPQMPEIVAALKPPEKLNFIGTDKMPFVDAQNMVTGKAVYGADADPHRPGMLTAMIVRCPVANGTVKSFDPTAALAVPGVRSVTEVLPKGFPIIGGVGGGFMPHAGVAVVAENTWAALQGRRALKDKVEWDLGSPAAASNATYESNAYRDELKKKTDQPGNVLRSWGNVDAA